MMVELLEQRIGIAGFAVDSRPVDTAMNRDVTRNRGGSELIE
jgi:hypothetical protein